MASNGARQKRIEKRRRRKWEQRRTEQEGWSIPLMGDQAPHTRMSQVLADFGEPLLSKLHDGAGAKEWRGELSIAALVWNSVLAGESREGIVRSLSRHVFDREVEPLVDLLVERKEKLFSDERRLIVSFDTYESGDRVHVVALSAR